MSKYELAVVVSAKIEDDERAAVVDKCKALIERFGGTVTNVDDWGKKRMAYEVENRIRIMDNVLRFLIVKQDEV